MIKDEICTIIYYIGLRPISTILSCHTIAETFTIINVIIHNDQVMDDFEHTVDILLSGQEVRERKIIKHNFINEHGQQDYYASTFSLFLDPVPLSSFEPASL